MIYPDPLKNSLTPAPASAQDHARVYIPPLLIYAFVFWVARILNSLVPLAQIARPARALGWTLAVAGLGLALWSVGLFRKAGTNPLPMKPSTAIVKDGPYRLSRNPMYLGFLLVFAGAALGTNTVWGFVLVPVLLLLMTGLVIRKEERYLEAKFGAEYTEYKRSVRRWI